MRVEAYNQVAQVYKTNKSGKVQSTRTYFQDEFCAQGIETREFGTS